MGMVLFHVEVPGVLLCVGLGAVQALEGGRGAHVGGLDVLLQVVALGEGLWAVGAGQGSGGVCVARCQVTRKAVLLCKALVTLGTREGGRISRMFMSDV